MTQVGSVSVAVLHPISFRGPTLRPQLQRALQGERGFVNRLEARIDEKTVFSEGDQERHRRQVPLPLDRGGILLA